MPLHINLNGLDYAICDAQNFHVVDQPEFFAFPGMFAARLFFDDRRAGEQAVIVAEIVPPVSRPLAPGDSFGVRPIIEVKARNRRLDINRLHSREIMAERPANPRSKRMERNNISQPPGAPKCLGGNPQFPGNPDVWWEKPAKCAVARDPVWVKECPVLAAPAVGGPSADIQGIFLERPAIHSALQLFYPTDSF
jgi:hypothetical protein